MFIVALGREAACRMGSSRSGGAEQKARLGLLLAGEGVASGKDNGRTGHSADSVRPLHDLCHGDVTHQVVDARNPSGIADARRSFPRSRMGRCRAPQRGLSHALADEAPGLASFPSGSSSRETTGYTRTDKIIATPGLPKPCSPHAIKQVITIVRSTNRLSDHA